jgi:hypothetical protein
MTFETTYSLRKRGRYQVINFIKISNVVLAKHLAVHEIV